LSAVALAEAEASAKVEARAEFGGSRGDRDV
jgi:hypothetical protein